LDEPPVSDASPIFCDRCLAILKPGEGNFYVATIDAVADPTPPRLEPASSQRDLQQEIREIIHKLEGMSEREMEDQVHRRVIIHLCQRCFGDWIENPAGR